MARERSFHHEAARPCVEVLAWAVFFVLAALVLAVRFWLLPDIERYREEIVGAVSAAVGQPVRIGGSARAGTASNPHIHLRDVRIFDRAGREALTLPSIDNQLAWSSLLQGRLKCIPSRSTSSGCRCAATPRARSMSRDEARRRRCGFARWLLAQDEIVLRDAEIEWHDELRGAPPLELSAVNLRLRNAGERHCDRPVRAAAGRARRDLELRAMLAGHEARRSAAWKGRLYAELGYTDLAAWRRGSTTRGASTRATALCAHG
jgi:uncharacterized protein YhdP